MASNSHICMLVDCISAGSCRLQTAQCMGPYDDLMIINHWRCLNVSVLITVDALRTVIDAQSHCRVRFALSPTSTSPRVNGGSVYTAVGAQGLFSAPTSLFNTAHATSQHSFIIGRSGGRPSGFDSACGQDFSYT